MPLPQAVALASLITVAVIGFIGLVWRSTWSDHTASLLRALLNVASAVTLVVIGVALLLIGDPNIFVAAGLAVSAFAYALKTAVMTWAAFRGDWTMMRLLRIQWSGNVVAGTLCAIGSFVYGGSVGMLGVLVASYWTLLHLWLIRRVRNEQQSQG
jgi:hypothetical protein